MSVSDKVKSDLEKVVKQDFISSNGAYIPEESKRHDVIKQYLNTIPSEQRNSASWTLSQNGWRLCFKNGDTGKEK